jgi:hypothetical protein
VDDEELFAELSGRLRDAHRRVTALDLPDDEKARVIRRLLAISDATKHNLTRAAQRLDAFSADLDAGWRPGSRDG